MTRHHRSSTVLWRPEDPCHDLLRAVAHTRCTRLVTPDIPGPWWWMFHVRIVQRCQFVMMYGTLRAVKAAQRHVLHWFCRPAYIIRPCVAKTERPSLLFSSARAACAGCIVHAASRAKHELLCVACKAEQGLEQPTMGFMLQSSSCHTALSLFPIVYAICPAGLTFDSVPCRSTVLAYGQLTRHCACHINCNGCLSAKLLLDLSFCLVIIQPLIVLLIYGHAFD